ncbi:5-oxoprolinase subunit PxpB [Sporolactobacillus sp. THM7-4]|nr:5-oxoprolinase subunit PxpB [Sporolactobacillus sp. THM7-4]
MNDKDEYSSQPVKEKVQMLPLGDTAVTVSFGDKIDETINQQARVLSNYLDSHPFPGMKETVVGYTAVTVYYDPVTVFKHHPQTVPFSSVKEILSGALAAADGDKHESKERVRHIPVCYGGAFGPDLHVVAALHGRSEQEVVRRHSETAYRVYMIGFTPGFPYLGGLPEDLATPRRKSPRLSVPAGSVGIAGSQTGVYPFASPGGWQIIGRTPIKLFDLKRDPPNRLQAGDRLYFDPITPDQFKHWKGAKGHDPACE